VGESGEAGKNTENKPKIDGAAVGQIHEKPLKIKEKGPSVGPGPSGSGPGKNL
jgi:hypothetical protein